ncbi:tyrosine-protein kinase JAK2-like [Sycon ciliatum]|uniref:tyrosine-protein kinase JAK2-like n=1 Tax=Sycon ciliatum TaxID=27933 RepID=UPI0020AB2730|eukprot:scpid9437/ scgid13458/ Tyrosine-protein kinase HTK16
MSVFRKKKQGCVNFYTGHQELAIDFKPGVAVKSILDAALNYIKVAPAARIFFCLAYEKDQVFHSLCPFRTLDRSEAPLQLWLRIHLRHKNAVELQRVDAIAFDYYFIQCKWDFVADLFPMVSRDNQLRLACLDIAVAMKSLGIDFDSAIKSGLEQFVPPSFLSLYKTKEVKRVLLESLGNFASLQPNACKVHYVEILEATSGFSAHGFKASKDVLTHAGKTIQEPVEVWIMPGQGILELSAAVGATDRRLVSDWGSLAGVNIVSTSKGGSVMQITVLGSRNEAYTFDVPRAAETCAVLMDAYYRLLANPANCVLQGLLAPVPNSFKPDLPKQKSVVPRFFTHGPITRDQALKILQKDGMADGLYLVRENSRNPGCYGLSLAYKGDAKHYFIAKNEDAKYAIEGGVAWSTLPDLLEHYMKSRDGLCCQLGKIVLPAQHNVLPKPPSEPSTPTQAAPPSPAMPLGPYEIPFAALDLQVVLGQGMFGTTHLAQWKKSATSPTPCVAKSLHSLMPFLQHHIAGQVQTLCKLKNNAVCQLFGVCHSTGSEMTMLIYEKVKDGALDIYLKRESGSLANAPQQLIKYCYQIADGMAFLAGEGVVHGGLKAHSVLVANRDSLRLSDVGLLQQISSMDTNYMLTGPGKSQVPWLSPECLSAKPLTLQSDVYACGMTLWEVFTLGAQTPFMGTAESAIASAIQKGQRPPSPGPLCSDEVFKIIGQCWQASAESRPTIASVRSQLRDCVKVPELTRHTSTRSQDSPRSTGSTGSRRNTSSSQVSTDASTVLAQADVINASDLKFGRDLGKGQFGFVKQAAWRRSDGSKVQVAVKSLHSSATPEQRQEFFREAKTMIALDNPHIVRLLGICTDNELLLITELVPLGALNSYLTQDNVKRSCRAPTLTSFALQIAKGMQFLENKRFVHRDLAARNILVADPQTVKITDFGLSRMFNESDYYTAGAMGLWPVKWYAPECMYYKKFTSSSDVWSFGVTCWELFSYGQKPYKGKGGQEVLGLLEEGHRLDQPEECPAKVYAVMQTCWQYRPDDRPTFAQLAQQLSLL